MTAMPQILATKLYLPRPTTMQVARPRLRDRLQAALERPLTTVIAPPGFGKTTLVSSWAAGAIAEKVAVAWLTLDAYDDDPSRFWTAIVAALQTIDPELGSELLPLLSTMTPSSSEYLLAPLINQLAEGATAPIVLVLDDYHAISAPSIHTALAFVVDHLPPHVHLIVTSRNDPPLPLPRLRARGQLIELRAADLRFTPAEAASFLNDIMRLQLTPEMIAALDERTEGWIAGLHLVALSMQNHTDHAAFVRALTGSHHFILDYLVEEVLQRQPIHIRDFLLQTAILDQLCASLCNAVTESVDSSVLLKTVEHANLFLIPLDDTRCWYRYHQLFAEMLRARLAQEQTALIPELHRRASAWYAQHAAGETAMLGEAIRHALASGDGDRAVAIIDGVAETIWSRNEVTTLTTWLMSLPTAVLHAHPRQTVRLAQILLVNASLADVPPLLDAAMAALARGALPPDEQVALHGRIAVVRSYLARIVGQFDQAVALAEEALRLLPNSAGMSRALGGLALALAHHGQGSLPVADTRYCEAITMCEALGDRFTEITTRCLHGRLLQERGDLMAAEAAFQQALERATQGTGGLPIAGWAMVGLGTVAYARNDLQTAEDLLVNGLDLGRRGGVRNAVYHGLRGLVRLRLAQGDLSGARGAAAEFMQEAQASQLPHFVRWAMALQALVAFRSDNLVAAAQWARIAQPRPDALFFTDKSAFLLFVRVLLAQGQTVRALEQIARQRAYLAPHGHVETLIELHLLEAIALIAASKQDAACIALESALALAAPAGFVRLFLDAGEPIKALLAQRPKDDPLHAFVDQLLAAFGKLKIENAELRKAVGQPIVPGSHFSLLTSHFLVEPLSERELEVLRLMADGCSNQEIAGRLIISVPTVKKHGSNIFGKLRATNRTEAVARARELGLLS